jgi:hypothetical protein
MATNRFQFSDDFILNNGNVGINTAIPQEKLDVVSIIKGDDLKVTGLSSFTTYDGFLNSNQNITETTTISGDKVSGSLSGEIIVGTGVTATVAEEATSSQGNIDSLKVYNTFTVPVGGTVDRPSKANPGQLYYNIDFKTIEFWDGNVWRQVDNTTRSGRGVIMGGRDTPGATVSEIDFIQVTTLGNSQSFGDLQSGNMEAGACCADSTRALKTGGISGGTEYDNIDYVTIASQGNSIDFGNLQAGTRGHGCCSSSSRGVTGGGVIAPNSDTNRMDYFEIQTLGNALDFGDLVVTERNISMISSPTRGVHDGGNYPSTTTLGHFTIASKGNSIEFGSNSRSAYGGGVVGNNIRGIFCGGYNASGASEGIKKIEYITFSSLGKTTNFGELSGLVSANNGGMSNNSRGVIGPGNKTFTGSVDFTNTLEYITISTLGNSQDFGDVSGPMRTFSPKVSDSHGGLGGF